MVFVTALAVRELVLYIQHRKPKENLVRRLGSNLPSVLFPRAPRIYVSMHGLNCPASEQILNRKRCPALSELEEFCDEGIIVAYAKSSDTEETESVEPYGEADQLNDLDAWVNTNTSIKFDPT